MKCECLFLGGKDCLYIYIVGYMLTTTCYDNISIKQKQKPTMVAWSSSGKIPINFNFFYSGIAYKSGFVYNVLIG